MEGTYPLPEAQLDRFLFNVVIDYLPEDDEVSVVSQTTARQKEEIEPLFSAEDVLKIHNLVRQVPIAENLVRYAVRLAAASRPKQANVPDFIQQWVSWGAGLRGPQAMVLGAKARALLEGRNMVIIEDLLALAGPVLRHRILLNFRAEADRISVDEIIQRLIKAAPRP
jgi:MoxR-like ATPase